MAIFWNYKRRGGKLYNVKSWLYIVTNQAIQKYHIQQRRREGFVCNLEEYFEESWAKEAFFVWNNDIIYGELTKGLLWEKVLSLKGLGPEIIRLHYQQGYKLKEIASILKKKESTVRTIKRRALRELKEILLKEGRSIYER